MKEEKVFYMDQKRPTDFDEEVIDYLVNNYGCDKSMAYIRLHDCLSFGWSLCDSPNGIVGIQTNYDRSQIVVGE